MSPTKKTSKNTPPAGIAPADLTPDIVVPEGDKLYWAWVGAFANAPRNSVDVAGVSFPKMIETLHRSSTIGRTSRQQHAGCLVKLSFRKLELIAEKLKRSVFRFVEHAPDFEHPLVLNLDQRYPRNDAHLIPIPALEDFEAAKKRGRTIRPYVATDKDRPVGDYIYLQLVDEVNPKQRPVDATLPPPITKTGIPFPPEDMRPVPESERVGKGASVWNGAPAPRNKPLLPQIDAAREAEVAELVGPGDNETIEQYAERTRSVSETQTIKAPGDAKA